MRKLTLLTLLAGMMIALTAGVSMAAVTDFRERGAGTTEQTSPPGCQFGGTCTDKVSGSIAGNPVDNPRVRKTAAGPAGIMGTVSSDFSQATQGPGGPGTYSVPTTGDVRLADIDGGKLFLHIEGTTTGDNTGTTATFEGTFTVTKGTGQFRDVKGGSGDVEFEVTDAGTTSTFTAFLDGSLRRAADGGGGNDDGKGGGDGKGNGGNKGSSKGRCGVQAIAGSGGAKACVGGVKAIAR